jgi:phage terminase large subunit GpA-like protein
MVIEATCVDTGGHNTHAVYTYCRNHAHANVLAIKGASQANRPVIGKPSLIDITWRGKTVPRSLKLWPIGTDTAKHLIYGRMRVTQVGPGYVHVPDSLKTTDEFDQMTAARLMPVVVQGKASMRWITPVGRREEGGDCMVYAYAAACHLGIQTYREPGWARREAKVAPREPDLFAPKTESITTESEATKPRPIHRPARNRPVSRPSW